VETTFWFFPSFLAQNSEKKPKHQWNGIFCNY